MELGALRPGTFDPNVAAVLLNYPVANAESKAGAPANFLVYAFFGAIIQSIIKKKS